MATPLKGIPGSTSPKPVEFTKQTLPQRPSTVREVAEENIKKINSPNQSTELERSSNRPRGVTVSGLSAVTSPVNMDRLLGKRKSSSDPDMTNNAKVVEPLIKTNLSYLLQLREDKTPFDLEKGVTELTHCIASFPNFPDVIKAALIPLKGTELLEKVLIRALLKPQNGAFFSSYFKGADETDAFAKKALEQLVKEQKPIEIVLLLTYFSELDFQISKSRDTLGRTGSLSSSLCREFANYYWKNELSHFDAEIMACLKKHKLKDLIIDRTTLLKLEKKTLSEDKVLKKQIEHAKHYVDFARSILTKLYAMKVPDEVSLLFTARRMCLISVLEAKREKKQVQSYEEISHFDESRQRLSEVIFLRVIIPRIVSLYGITTDEAKAVLPLTKIVKALAFETRAVDPNNPNKSIYFEPADKVSQTFNPLVEEFEKRHQAFVDLHSLKSQTSIEVRDFEMLYKQLLEKHPLRKGMV